MDKKKAMILELQQEKEKKYEGKKESWRIKGQKN
jgi:hypothetical protein